MKGNNENVLICSNGHKLPINTNSMNLVAQEVKEFNFLIIGNGNPLIPNDYALN